MLRRMSEKQADPVLVVRCECGFEARGSADELVPAMQRHAKEVHNMDATREQVLERAQPA